MNNEVRELIIMLLIETVIIIVAIVLEIAFSGMATFLLQCAGVYAIAKVLTKLLLKGVNANETTNHNH